MPPQRRNSFSDSPKRMRSEAISTTLRLNIFVAAAKNNHQVLRQQLETIGYADILDLKNETPLNVVSKKTDCAESRETAKILLSYGADMLWKDYHGSTSAAYFFIRRDEDFIDLVLNILEDVNVPLDSEGNTALHLAVEARVESTILKLLNRGADPNRKNKQGLTPIHRSVTKLGFSFLRHMFNHGGDINIPTPDSQTPLHMASRMGHRDCLEAVLYCNPELEAKDKDGFTPLLILASRHNHLVHQIHEMLEDGVDPSFQGSNGDNCLHSLIRHGKFEKRSLRLSFLVRLFLQYGVDVDAFGYHNETALHISAYTNKPIATFTLMRYGADMKKKSDFEYPLDTAFITNHCLVINVLVKYIAIRGGDIQDYISRSHHIHKLAATRVYLTRHQAELEHLKTVLVYGTNLTYYDIITISLTTLTDYMGTSLALREISARNLDPSVVFYRQIVIWKLQDGLRCWIARKEVISFMEEVFALMPGKICVPRKVTEYIVSFFGFHEVLKLQRRLTDELEDEYEHTP